MRRHCCTHLNTQASLLVFDLTHSIELHSVDAPVPSGGAQRVIFGLACHSCNSFSPYKSSHDSRCPTVNTPSHPMSPHLRQ